MPPPISYIITVASPDTNANHGSEEFLPRAKNVGILGVEICLARILLCILKTGKIE